MIRQRTGDLLDQVDLELIAHQVNCQGKMGAGIAAQLASRYPAMYRCYRRLCVSTGTSLMGTFAAISSDGRVMRLNRLMENDPCMVINVFAQRRPGRGLMTDYAAFERAFTKLHAEMVARGYATLGVPHGIGCGLAGGDWDVIYGILERIFARDDRVTLYIVKLP